MPDTELTLSYLPRILIIDDNQDIHRDFRLAFVRESPNPDLQASEDLVFPGEIKHNFAQPAYELEHALSGLEGIERLRQSLAKARPFQLAFVDIRMPGIDGVETVSRLWQIDPSIQIVLVTAYADYSWDELVTRLGYTDKLLMLKKPFEYIEVIQMASTLAEKWFLGRQAALWSQNALTSSSNCSVLMLATPNWPSLPRLKSPKALPAIRNRPSSSS